MDVVFFLIAHLGLLVVFLVGNWLVKMDPEERRKFIGLFFWSRFDTEIDGPKRPDSPDRESSCE